MLSVGVRRTAPARAEPREKWAWGDRVLYWLYGFFLGPFLTKHPDGTITGAMTRWAVALFTCAECYRLVTITAPLGVADAFVIFFILFALPIDAALTKIATKNPERLLELLERLSPVAAAQAVADYGHGPLSAPVAAGAGVLSFEDLQPPVTHGRPTEDDE